MQAQNTENTNPPLELGSIIEAEPVAFSFDTLGWKILFVILAFFISWLLFRFYKSYQKNAYRREAIKNINHLKTSLSSNKVELVSKVMFQLKQTALQTYSRKEVAALKGEEWLQFLDHKANLNYFSANNSTISEAIYKGSLGSSLNIESFLSSSIKWIKRHA